MPARHAHAAGDAWSSSKPSNDGASPAHRRMTPTQPGPQRHDPAWLTCIPPRGLCASGDGDAHAEDAAPRADQHLTPLSQPKFKREPAPDDVVSAQQYTPIRPLDAPQTDAKTEKPIGQHPRPAASCFGGYRTPAGARFPSHNPSFAGPSQSPNFRHLFISLDGSFPEEFRAPAGVRKSRRPEPASPKYRPMGILSLDRFGSRALR